jgi:uncharacterized protein YlxW (UPF0749 family)
MNSRNTSLFKVFLGKLVFGCFSIFFKLYDTAKSINIIRNKEDVQNSIEDRKFEALMNEINVLNKKQDQLLVILKAIETQINELANKSESTDAEQLRILTEKLKVSTDNLTNSMEK